MTSFLAIRIIPAMKALLFALVLSTPVFAASYQKNLYPNRGHIEMYQCEPGVKAAFQVWTTTSATLRLSNFKLGFHDCGFVVADTRVYTLKLKTNRRGEIWVGNHSGSGRTVRVYDYRKGAGPTVRVEAPFIVEEYDANGNLIQRLYPATGSRG